MRRNKHLKVQGDIRDRGTTKWQGLMLPEHMAMLREWHAEDKQVPRPDLDEHDLALIQDEIQLALARRCEARVQTYKDFAVHSHVGTIETVDMQARRLVIDGVSLPLADIIAVQLIE